MKISLFLKLCLCFSLIIAFSEPINVRSVNTQLLQNYLTINVSEAKELIENETDLFLLDVRTESEYNEGYIEGATLIPHDQIENQSEKLPSNKSRPILVYCRSGTRSAIASSTLVSLNYTAVYNMDGGFLAWKDAGYPYLTESSSETITLSQGTMFFALLLFYLVKKYGNR